MTPLKICGACDGRAYAPRATMLARDFSCDPVTRACDRCRGSGIEGHSARSAYLREHALA